jgi:hypothetical protein
MPEPPTPTPAPAIGNPTAPVPKAALLPATVTALLTIVGVLCLAASVWGWFLCRLCLHTGCWVLGGGSS